MAEPRFAGGDDDLPRALKRAREERERELRQQRDDLGPAPSMAAPAEAALGAMSANPAMFDNVPSALRDAGTVTRLDIPFLHLMRFCIKFVFAAIPAIVLLGSILWLGGKGLQAFFPALGRMRIFIDFGT